MSDSMVLGLIPARGGSKGIPGKNIRALCGKPLLSYAIDCANQCDFIDHVVVSTDSDEIKDVARASGAEVPFVRPGNLAEDTTPMLPVLQHAITECEPLYDATVTCLVLIDATAPLRTVADMYAAYELFCNQDCAAVISGSPSHRSPYFNMVAEHGGFVHLVSESDPPVGCRQAAPPTYDLNTVVWIYSRSALMDEKARIPEKALLCQIPPERAIDLDTEFDFEIAELLLSRRRHD